MSTILGQDPSGDFNQLSLAGVDYGEDYTVSHAGLTPNNLNSEAFGMESDFGVTPEGMMYGVPEGMGHYAQMGGLPEPSEMGQYLQLGHDPYQQLGQAGFMAQLQKPIMAGIPIPTWAALGVAAWGVWWFYFKK